MQPQRELCLAALADAGASAGAVAAAEVVPFVPVAAVVVLRHAVTCIHCGLGPGLLPVSTKQKALKMKPSDGDDWQVIQPRPMSGPTPPELSTGDPDDDQLLRQIAARVRLDQPRAVKHYLYVPDEESAQMLARPLTATGWQAEIFAPDDKDDPYCVTAERDGIVVTADLVRNSRELFQKLVSVLPGAEYDGWEVSTSVDEYLPADS